MKIAYVLDRFPVLSETFILNQIAGLIDAGHDVDLYAKSLHTAGVVQPEVVRLGLAERARFWPDLPASKSHRFLRALRLLAQQLREGRPAALRCADVLHYGVEAANGNLVYASALIRTPQAYDVIHAHFGNVGVRAQGLRDLARLRGPLVTTFHGFDLSHGFRSGRMSRLLSGYGVLFRRGDLFLPISDRWRERLIELGCPPDRIVVHRMGVDLDRFVLRPQAALPDRPLRLVSVARLVEKKGISIAIDAVDRLIERGHQVEYTVIGDGPLRAALETRAGEYRATGVIRFMGAVPQDQVAAQLSRANILVAPSLTARNGDEEGLPVVIMEAMASGLLVVASKHSGIPELVVDRVTGYLAPEGDPVALATVLAEAAEHRDRWQVMRSAARRAVEEHHDIRKLNAKLMGLFARLAEGPSPA